MLLAFGACWVLCLGVGAWQSGDLLAWEMVAAVPWGAAIWNLRRAARGSDLVAIVGIAILGRLVLLGALPVLSDDVYRYLWDGRVQLAGVDPYAYPPSAPQLAALRDEFWTAINFRDHPTIYPPVAQLLFRAVAASWPSPLAFRVVAATTDVASVVLLAALLRWRGTDPRASVVLAWCPLSAVESAVGAHIDASAITLLVAAMLALQRARPLAAGAWAGLSVCVKPAAALLLPLLAAGRRARLCAGLAIGLAPLALYLDRPLMPSFGEYARRWRHNDFLFAPIHAASLAVAGDEPRRWPQPLARWATGRESEDVYPDEVAGVWARLVAATAWAALAAFTVARAVDPARGGLLLVTAALLLAPVAHPWYFCWLLPFSALMRVGPILLLLALAPLGYLASAAWWPRCVEYGLPALVAVALVTSRRFRTLSRELTSPLERARLRLVSGGERIGSILNGTYRLERLLGEGGMGTVYEAVHQRVPRRFAIKMLNPEILGNKEVFERFRREAEIASSLGSQHIVQVFDFNHGEDGSPYMVLELLEGQDLAQRLTSRGRMPLELIARIMNQLGPALAKAHAAGIVHRDLKPANIFLTRVDADEDFVKVLDFGISKVLHGNTGATRTGTVFGTPNYMSPEQAEGRQGEIDARTDIFAIGAILYECVTGQMAFNAPTLIGTIYQVCHGSPQPVRSFAPDVPEAVERVLARALAKQRDLRHPDIEALREDFARACTDTSAQSFAFATIPTVPPPPAGPVASVSPTTLGSASSERLPTAPPPASLAPSGGRGGKVIAIAAAGGIALGAAMWLSIGRSGTDAAVPPAPPVAVASEPVAAPPPAASPAPTVTPPPAAAAPAAVEIRLKLTPPDAKVEVDGLVTTENPLRLPVGDRSYKIVVSAPGYSSFSRDFRPLMNSELVATLARQSAAPAKPAPAKAKKKKVELEDW